MIEELEEIFVALLSGNKRKINLKSDKYTAYAFDEGNSYGVYFPYDGSIKINEKFNSIHLYTASTDNNNILLLTCNNKLLRHNFAYIAWDFISIDKNNRENIISNPYNWFDKWKEATGNFKKNLMIYDVIAEMKCLLELKKMNKEPKWSAINIGTHDIEANDGAYEVKSTINKTNMLIHISNVFQLSEDNGQNLFLLFCRVEKSKLGYSIDDLLKELIKNGLEEIELENYLEKIGYPTGKKERYEKYIIREIIQFKVDENFPKLTLKSFKENKLPLGVISFNYVIDLYNLTSEKIY